MARVVMTLKIMPDGVEIDLDDLLERIKSSIPEGTDVGAIERQPVAFGLIAIRMNLVRDESRNGFQNVSSPILASNRILDLI
jgi:elongation factor 1-beta